MKFDRTSYTSNTSDHNAASRIDAEYRPTVNMPGRNLPQLMRGLEYPNATVLGLEFDAAAGWDLFGWDLDGTLGWDMPGNSDALLDTLLRGPTFTDTVPKLYTIAGGEFPDGYAPEELVAGVVSDSLSITVISSDATLCFRQIVDRANNHIVFNTNPYTQVFLTATLEPTDTVISVSNVNALIDARFNRVGNIIYINGEFIRFTTVDSTTNQLGGLQRGIMGSAVSTTVVGGTIGVGDIQPGILYSIVVAGSTDFTQGGAPNNTAGTVFYANSNSVNLTGSGTVIPVIDSVLERDKLFGAYESLWWYGPPSDPSANTTLATNTSVPAEFLQQTSP